MHKDNGWLDGDKMQFDIHPEGNAIPKRVSAMICQLRGLRKGLLGHLGYPHRDSPQFRVSMTCKKTFLQDWFFSEFSEFGFLET